MFSLFQDIAALPMEILGRMPKLGKKFPAIQQLVDDATKHVMGLKEPTLAPLYPCLPPPGETLKDSMGGIKRMFSFDKEAGKCIALMKSGEVTLWDLIENESVNTFPRCDRASWQLAGQMLVSCDGERVVSYFGESGLPMNSFRPFPSTAKAGKDGRVVELFALDYHEKIFCCRQRLPC